MAKEASEINKAILEEWLDVVSSTDVGSWTQGIQSKSAYFSPITRIGEKYSLMQITTRLQLGANILACVKCTYKKTTAIIGYICSEALVLDLKRPLSDDEWFAKYGGEPTEDPEGFEESPKTFRHCHVVHGHSYSSQDGQYMGRFQPWERFLEVYSREEFSPIISEASSLMMKLMNTKKLRFQVDICYPEDFQHRRDYEDSINCSRICNKLFEVSWAIDNYHQYLSIVPSHINLNYAAVILHETLHRYFTSRYKESENKELWWQLRNQLTLVKEEKYSNFKLGQKIIPMSVEEYINPWSITQSFWRELFISLALTELVFNGCCLGFPLVAGWSQADSVHAGIFENASLHERYQHGQIAEEMAKELQRVEANTRPFGVFRSPSYVGYSDKIKDAIKYGETTIVMSKSAGIIVYEDVGPTLANWHTYVESPKLTDKGYQNVLLWPNAARIVADWLTSFISMHERLSCVHGDLHMNNMTIDCTSTATRLKSEHCFAYILGESLYLYPDDGARGYIIDSSKSILMNTSALSKVLPSHEVATYARGLPNVLAKFLCSYYPQYEKREAEITHYAEKFPRNMQEIAESVDVGNLGKNMAHFSAYGNMKCGEEFIKFGERLVEKSSARIAQILNDMASADQRGGSIELSSGLARECFGELMEEFRISSREELVEKVGTKFLHSLNCDIKLTRKISIPLTQWKSCAPSRIEEICAKYGVSPPPVWQKHRDWNAVKEVKQPKKYVKALEEYFYI